MHIEVNNLKKTFAGAKGPLQVIAGVSFAVAKGECIAFVGPSGCGKTTLINLMAGFDRPDSGEIRIEGAAKTRPNSKALVISQQGSVFPWLTVEQNTMFGLSGSNVEKAALVRDCIALVGLQGFEKGYPNELSGGMVKRVEIARALIMKPDILFMDEPFSTLDALTGLRLRTELLRILKEERQTVLLITHDIEEALHVADRIHVLSDRPASIHATFEVPLNHPRHLSSPEVQTIKEEVLRVLFSLNPQKQSLGSSH